MERFIAVSPRDLALRPVFHVGAVLFLAACASRRPETPARAAAPVDVTVPVVAASSAPPVATAAPVAEQRPTLDPARAKALLADRDRCLHDPTCSRDETQRLTRDAADAGATVDCALFYYGTVVTVDWQRARSCYEREVRSSPACGGSSPSLDRIQLAIMLVDGQGGPKMRFDDIKPIMGDCFEDASVSALREPMPKEPVDFCNDIGGTTLSMNECSSGRIDRANLEHLLIRKDIAASIGKDALAKEDEAASRFDRFATAAADLVSDTWRGGSGRGFVFGGEEETLIDQRNRALTVFAAPVVFASAKERADLEKDHRTLAQKVQQQADAERKKLFHDAEAAFVEWRTAEIAFERATAKPTDGDNAQIDAVVRATRMWNGSLERLTADH
jgi:hypothetical protein